MIVTASPVTLLFAILIGLLSLAAGIGGLIRPGEWQRMFDEFEASPGLMMAIAFTAILFGMIVILVHPFWHDPLAVLVSVLGWASFIEGLALLAVPHFWIGMVKPLLGYARAWALVSLLLGLGLLACGLAGRADPLLAL